MIEILRQNLCSLFVVIKDLVLFQHLRYYTEDLYWTLNSK